MPNKKKLSEKTDKRYRAKIVIGHGPDGKPIYKYASARTKDGLSAARREVRRTYVTGDAERKRGITFEAYAKEWYEIYKKPFVSYSSRQSYATIFNKHLFPVLANRQLAAITADDLQSLLYSKAGCCAATIGYVHTILTNVFAKAYARGLIDRDPSVSLKKPSAEKQSRRALTEAETTAALKVAYEHPWGLLILLLYHTGMRLGEVAGLQWRDVDFKRRMVCVRRDVDFKAGELGAVKTKYSIRDIPMSDELVAALSPIRGVGEAFVFANPSGSFWRNSSLHRLCDELAQAIYQADPTIDAREVLVRTKGGEVQVPASILTPHYFRHNYASILYNAGVDVLSARKFLGHASIKTTLEIYTHLSEAKEDENAEKARAALSKGCQPREQEEIKF